MSAQPWNDPGQIAQLGRVAVLCGGNSAEREISLQSGAAVTTALQAMNIDCMQIDTVGDWQSGLVSAGADIAFIALHGRGGEDGTVQGYLETIGMPYSGSKVLGSALAMDKWLSKLIWQSLDVPVPNGMLLTAETDWQEAGSRLGFPVFVKPVHEGSSIGMSRVEDAGELRTAWEEASRYDSLVLAESFVSGAEFTVGILDGQALPILRLDTPREFYDYDAKYVSNDTTYLYPSSLDAQGEAELAAIAQQAFSSLGCSGWGRVDVMQAGDSSFRVLEVNTVPGLTDHSLVPMAAAHAGISFGELVLRILFAVRREA